MQPLTGYILGYGKVGRDELDLTIYNPPGALRGRGVVHHPYWVTRFRAYLAGHRQGRSFVGSRGNLWIVKIDIFSK